MKIFYTKFLVLLALLGSSSLLAQEKGTFEFTALEALKKYEPLVVEPDKRIIDSKTLAQKGYRFSIHKELMEGYVIKFLKFTGISSLIEEFNINGKKTLYFYITKTQFNDSTQRYISKDPNNSFVFGALIVPIKIRPGGEKRDENGVRERPFDFGGEINIGLSIGYKRKLKKNFYVMGIAGLNLTSISIDNTTIKNDLIQDKTNAASITPFLGLVFQLKGVQIIGATGWDRLAGRIGENWVYQGKPWYGLGVGFNIFNSTNNNPEKQP